MPASWHFFQDKCQQKNDFKRSLYKSRRLISNPHFWEYFNFFRFSWRPTTATFSPKAEGLRISNRTCNTHRCTQIHLDQAPTVSILNFFEIKRQKLVRMGGKICGLKWSDSQQHKIYLLRPSYWTLMPWYLFFDARANYHSEKDSI